MNYLVLTYLLYITISLMLTVWVANVLFKNGRSFLLDIFERDGELVDSINKLLVVGFYLLNGGYILLTLQESVLLRNPQDVIELLSHKIGVIILVLGFLHFGNLFIFYQLQKKSKFRKRQLPPPLKVPNHK